MSRSKYHWSRVGLRLCVMGLAFLGTVLSIEAQDAGLKSPAPAVDPPGKSVPPAVMVAPVSSTEADAAGDDSGEAKLPDRAEIEALLKAAEDAVDPDDAASQDLVDRYQEALNLYDAADQQRALLDFYVDALISTPEATEEARATLEATPQLKLDDVAGDGPPPGLTNDAGIDEINTRLSAARAAALGEESKLEELEGKVFLQQTRPEEISERIMTIREAISEAEPVVAGLKNKPDLTEVDQASLLKKRLEIKAFEAELAALEQEQLSYDERMALIQEQLSLASRLASNAKVETDVILRFADERLKDSVNEAAMVAEQARVDTLNRSEVVREVAAEIGELAKEFEEVDQDIEQSSSSADDIETRLSDLQNQYEQLKTQISIGGLREAQGEILIEQRRLMPNLRAIKAESGRSRVAISETRLNLYQNQRYLRDSPEEVATKLLEESVPPLTDAERETVFRELVALIEKRNELLEGLNGQYRRLLAEETDRESALSQLAVLTVDADDFLNESLLWVRSSEPIGLSSFSELPGGIAWFYGADRFEELKAALIKVWKRFPFQVLIVVAVFVALILTRSRCKRKIIDLGHKVQKISTDRYAFTFKAFLLTLVLALPYSIVLAFLGWRLLDTPEASNWLLGLAEGFINSGYLLVVVLFVRALCSEGGVGEQHFRWRRQPLRSVRENITWISVLYIPMAVIALMTMREKDAAHLASTGRLSFIVAMLWTAFFIRRLLDRETGVASVIMRDHPQSIVARMQGFWTFLFVSFPVVLIILALAGYTLTGYALVRQFRLTTDIIGLGAIVYAMILRWFSMRERKLSLEQRIQERRERAAAEAREAEGVEASMSDESGLPEFDEDSINFEEVGEQTRKLLRFAVGSGVGLAIWFGWADIVPAMRGLDAIMIMGGISLGALIPAIFILIVTTIGAKNLPGLLEIGVLRHLPIDAGLRYAITSLCQYIVVAVGLSFTFGVLGMDWSKLGWIAAALSVGLGFGLQEIVANFVCGIILLFERPIRVGDVVTVSETTGVVSRIRIRATTILDRDQKEFIVPNKEFITGSLLNWTLSTTLNRIVIVVGVAYGSDTRRARDLLLEICNAHPTVLKDPATTVIFDTFGDSTLNFTVRTYLASMENRLGVTNDLHHEIHERFGAEGIEIAFPQMDLHLRSIDPGVHLGGGGSAPDPGKA